MVGFVPALARQDVGKALIEGRGLPCRVGHDEPGPVFAEKLYRFVNPVPSVLTAKITPSPELPPNFAVPYRVSPDELVTNPPNGWAPSLLVKVGYGGPLLMVGVKL